MEVPVCFEQLRTQGCQAPTASYPAFAGVDEEVQERPHYHHLHIRIELLQAQLRLLLPAMLL
jgi:hypothetical protein